jgi:hypothetical protein
LSDAAGRDLPADRDEDDASLDRVLLVVGLKNFLEVLALVVQAAG